MMANSRRSIKFYLNHQPVIYNIKNSQMATFTQFLSYCLPGAQTHLRQEALPPTYFHNCQTLQPPISHLKPANHSSRASPNHKQKISLKPYQKHKKQAAEMPTHRLSQFPTYHRNNPVYDSVKRDHLWEQNSCRSVRNQSTFARVTEIPPPQYNFKSITITKRQDYLVPQFRRVENISIPRIKAQSLIFPLPANSQMRRVRQPRYNSSIREERQSVPRVQNWNIPHRTPSRMNNLESSANKQGERTISTTISKDTFQIKQRESMSSQLVEELSKQLKEQQKIQEQRNPKKSVTIQGFRRALSEEDDSQSSRSSIVLDRCEFNASNPFQGLDWKNERADENRVQTNQLLTRSFRLDSYFDDL